MRNKNRFRNELKQRQKNKSTINALMIFINGVLINHENNIRLQNPPKEDSKIYEHTINVKYEK